MWRNPECNITQGDAKTTATAKEGVLTAPAR